MSREQRVGLLVLVVALVTIVAMLWPLGDLPFAPEEVEVLDEVLER